MGAVTERLQGGRRGCENGLAVSGGWKCGWGRCWGVRMQMG